MLFWIQPTDIPKKLIGDPIRISQILINLANNAVKFTEHGSISISIGTIETEEHPIKLKFSVKDTGIGISEEQKNEYFGRGYTGIKNALSPELLNRLQDMAIRFEKDIKQLYIINRLIMSLLLT